MEVYVSACVYAVAVSSLLLLPAIIFLTSYLRMILQVRDHDVYTAEWCSCILTVTCHVFARVASCSFRLRLTTLTLASSQLLMQNLRARPASHGCVDKKIFVGQNYFCLIWFLGDRL